MPCELLGCKNLGCKTVPEGLVVPAGASQHAEMDCECARLQKLLAQSNQRCLQLQTALMSVQQETSHPVAEGVSVSAVC